MSYKDIVQIINWYLDGENSIEKMKNRIFIVLTCLFCTVCFSTVYGQAKTETKRVVQKRTLMNKFEPAYVMPYEERLELKDRRIAKQKRTKRILDTLSISDRKRRKLMRELKRSPFSKRIDEVIMANTQFEDEENDNQ